MQNDVPRTVFRNDASGIAQNTRPKKTISGRNRMPDIPFCGDAAVFLCKPPGSSAGEIYSCSGWNHVDEGVLRGVEGRKPALEIGFEIVDIFQSDMEPQGGSAGRPFGGGPVGRAVERNDKALEAAP